MRPSSSLYVLLALAIAVPASLPAQTLTFAAPVRISANNQSGNVQFLYLYGNFNGNGNTDIIDSFRGSNNNNVFEFLAGDGTGKFTDLGPVDLTTANAPNAAFAADVNGDGKDDIITLESACVGNICANPGSFNVLLSQGNGKFTSGYTASLPAGYLDLEGVVGDFNNDGKPDVAVLATSGNYAQNPVAPQLIIFLNKGNGSFTQTAYQLAPGIFTDDDGPTTNLVAGDFEGNGNQDLAFGSNGTGGESSDSSEIWTFAGDGKGGFGPAVASYTFDSGIIDGLYAADLNGDGRTDLVTGLQAKQGDGNTRVPSLLARESGKFYWSSAVYLAHKPFTSYPVIALSDLNGDGKPDLIFLNGPVTGGSKTAQAGVYLGLGNGVFKTPHIPLTVNASDFAQFIAAVPLKTGALPSLIVTYQLDYLELFVNTTKK